MLLVGLLCPLAAVAQAAPGNDAAAFARQAEDNQTAANSVQDDQIPESALPGAQTRLLGRTVEQVRVAGASGELQQTVLLEKIPLKTGERLERQSLRESLRVLFETGRFAELEAEATVLPSGGVAVEFRTKPNYFNGAVTVSGTSQGGSE